MGHVLLDFGADQVLGALEKHLSARDSFGFLVNNILTASSLLCPDITGFNRDLIGGRLCNFVFSDEHAAMLHKARAALSTLQDLSAQKRKAPFSNANQKDEARQMKKTQQ